MFLNTEFLKSNEIYLKIDKLADGDEVKQWLPAYHFNICMLDGTEVGICDLRIGHNKNTYYGGNIGYRIKPEYQGNHFAGKACFLLFELAKKHDLNELIITCNADNIASRKTCEYAGGVLENIIDLPFDNDMYLKGERKKCIYKFSI